VWLSETQSGAPGNCEIPQGFFKSGSMFGAPFLSATRGLTVKDVAARTGVASSENPRTIVVATLIAKAKTGDVAAIKEVMDRTDGKVATEVGGSEELGPIKITWMDDLDGEDSG